MVRRQLGKTGLKVSPIAFGAFKIGRNEKIKYAQHYPLPTDNETSKLLNGVLDLGINLIDTAPAYGLSEERIGNFLAPRRAEFILSTKAGESFENGNSTYDFSPPGITKSVERSLKRLKTDHLDFLFLHSDGRDLEIQQHAATLMQKLKRSGKVRFVGMSGKTVEGARSAMQWADALMIEYHPKDLSHEKVLGEAAKAGIAVLIKKPLSSGQLPAREAIPFILKRPEVGSLVIGGLNLSHIRENLKLASGA